MPPPLLVAQVCLRSLNHFTLCLCFYVAFSRCPRVFASVFFKGLTRTLVIGFKAHLNTLG